VTFMAGSSLKESKRDSKGDMPRGLYTQHGPLLPTCHDNIILGEACSRQRLLCSGASISDSAEEDLTRNTSQHRRSLGAGGGPWLRVQRLNGDVPRGHWVGLVASPGSLFFTPLVVQLPKPSIRSRGFGTVRGSFCQSGGEQVGEFCVWHRRRTREDCVLNL